MCPHTETISKGVQIILDEKSQNSLNSPNRIKMYNYIHIAWKILYVYTQSQHLQRDGAEAGFLVLCPCEKTPSS